MIHNLPSEGGDMYRKKDFILMDVLDTKGRKLGYIRDIIVDFNQGRVLGFIINPSRIFNKNVNILKKDIVYFNQNMIVKNTSKGNFLKFTDINNMDVVDKYGNIIGIAEDIIFKENSFKIEAIVVTTGLLKSFIKGKRVVLSRNIIFGDKNLLYYCDDRKLDFYCLPHKIFRDVDRNEESK